MLFQRKSYLLFAIFLVLLSAWLIRWQLRTDLELEAEQGDDLASSSVLVSSASSSPDSSQAYSLGRLVIPALGVDAKIETVGTNAKGNMGVPSNYKNVAWYRLGTKIGEKGNAVIAGHLDNSLGLPGVFTQLEKLQVGDEVRVVKANQTLNFRVVDKKSYPYNQAPLGEIFGPAATARLNLITCGGDWIKELKTYETRTIVFTELVS